MSKKRIASKKTRTAAAEIQPIYTALSRCLILDPIPPTSAAHDVDPFGVYHTLVDGSVVFAQSQRANPGYIKCATAEELDALISKVFLAATKHSRRHLVITKDYAHQFDRGQRKFAGSASQDVPVPWYPVDSIPKNVILFVTECHPEDLGQIHYHDGAYGISLIQPHLISSVEIVPEPFGRCRPEVLAR